MIFRASWQFTVSGWTLNFASDLYGEGQAFSARGAE
jgi:hypothetical protein